MLGALQGEACRVKGCGFKRRRRRGCVGGGGIGEERTITAWAQETRGDKMPDARDADDGCVRQLRRRGLRPGKRRQHIEGARDKERREAARDGLVHGLRAAGTFQTSRQSSLKYAQLPIPSRCTEAG